MIRPARGAALRGAKIATRRFSLCRIFSPRNPRLVSREHHIADRMRPIGIPDCAQSGAIDIDEVASPYNAQLDMIFLYEALRVSKYRYMRFSAI